jgi:murein DD-endopeptidase MepM/ murein hydrolase activator NlpD
MHRFLATAFDHAVAVLLVGLPLGIGALIAHAPPAAGLAARERPDRVSRRTARAADAAVPSREEIRAARGPTEAGPTEAGPTEAGPASVDGPPFVPWFPLSAPVAVTSTFGEPRPRGRRHEGTDLLAPKRTPVLAVADGRVRWLHGERGGRCCALELVHDEGWRSRYVHLDNDTPGTDDGQGYGIAEGLRTGSTVRAGDVIGWVGDSGNAEHVAPHLHFELRHPERGAVDATALLARAVAALEGGADGGSTGRAAAAVASGAGGGSAGRAAAAVAGGGDGAGGTGGAGNTDGGSADGAGAAVAGGS